MDGALYNYKWFNYFVKMLILKRGLNLSTVNNFSLAMTLSHQTHHKHFSPAAKLLG